MKRSITRWTMALATAGVLTLPVSSFAGTIQDPQPQPQQQQPPAQPQPQQPQPEPQPTPAPQQPAPTPTPQPSATATQPQAEQALTPQDHLKKAQEAANAISASSLPSKNKSAVEDMKRHLANLDKIASGAATATPTPAETGKKGAESAKNESINWGTEVGAIDKAITELVGTATEPSNPATPTPTGTSGKSTGIDDATRAKLMEVRSHITAYAAGMAGGSTPKTEAPAPKAEAAASPATEPRTEPSMTPSSPAPQNPPAQSPNPSPAQADPTAAAPAAQQPPAAQSPTAQAQPQTDTDVAHKHLVAARETLAQLTQLPAAAQLSGEPRNQVSQLITNFNALITTQSNWKESYDKVNANLNTLLGPAASSDEANAAPAANPGAPAPGAPTPGAPTPGAATPGAVGTAGTTSVEIDPSIRAKLIEFRKSLNEFRKAVGAQ